MSETNSSSTSNGYEIEHTREKLDFEEFKVMLKEYGLDGDTPAERLGALKNQSNESVGLFMSDLNRRLQGSDDTLVSERTMKIGSTDTIDPTDRYDIFMGVLNKIKSVDSDINPGRVGDILALTNVLLHPFEDGNGRTSRMIGFIYQPDFDGQDSMQTFDVLAESRDTARERGGFMVNGYVPHMREGVNQSDADQVQHYLDSLFTSDNQDLYVGTFGQSPLHT